ncbi:MAG TPA: phenylacetate--CoA ligase family protein [Ktedonobacterales bacterium]
MGKRIAAGLLAAGALGAATWGLWRHYRVAVDIWWAGRGAPEGLAARQRERLRALIAFARARSPYYRALYRDLPAEIEDLRALPVVTKPDLMARFDEWVTDPRVTRAGVEAFAANASLVGRRYLGRYVVWTTSGTTGKPGVFVQNPLAIAVYGALIIFRGYDWMPPALIWRTLWRGRMGTLVATGGHFAVAEWMERLRRQVAPLPAVQRRVRVFSVLLPLEELTRQLNDFQPTLLIGYPSVLRLLADEQRARRLHIAPDYIGLGGEEVEPGARERIAEAFPCVLRDNYGASEFLVLAYGCAHGWLHVNSDWVILEPVDAAYQPTPPGQTSQTVLLTNLANHVQPLIRYDLGDSVTLRADRCPCGSPLPAVRVSGRQGDTLRLLSPSGATVALPPLAIGAVVEETEGVRRAQIIQTSDDTLTVRLEVAAGAEPAAVWERLERRLRDYLATQGLPAVTIERSPEPPRQSPTSGKFRQVWRELR